MAFMRRRLPSALRSIQLKVNKTSSLHARCNSIRFLNPALYGGDFDAARDRLHHSKISLVLHGAIPANAVRGHA